MTEVADREDASHLMIHDVRLVQPGVTWQYGPRPHLSFPVRHKLSPLQMVLNGLSHVLAV